MLRRALAVGRTQRPLPRAAVAHVSVSLLFCVLRCVCPCVDR
jgi:hypothetical protein